MNPILELHTSTAGHPAPGLTFSTFVIGDSNREACTAAKYAAANSGRCGALLVLCGGSGMGKTHLLHAIHSELLAQNPTAVIKHLNADDFTGYLIQSIHTGTSEQFRTDCQNADVFLLDDVQFLVGKPRTQEELLLILEARCQANRCTVITLDCPPEQSESAERRFRSYFPDLVLARISAPDYEIRAGLIRAKAANLELQLSEEEIGLIAQHVTENLQSIHGILNRINLYRSFPDTFPDAPSIPEIIQNVLCS